MADSNSSNKKPAVRRRLHKGRLCGCLSVLVIIFILISTLIGGCTKKHNLEKEKNKNNKETHVTQTVVTDEKPAAPAPKRNYIICIDPGHGGEDNGSSNGDRLEKVDNLRYAAKVYEALSEHEGIDVIITRQSNSTDLSNKDRAEFANAAGADLYVALHRNHNDDRTANGVEIWIQQQPDVVDDVLGYKILEALKDVGIQNDRGVQKGFTNDSQNNFQIIEYTNMPACIVELGFISNDEDNKLFDEHYEDYAKAIAGVIIKMCDDGYLDAVDKAE